MRAAASLARVCSIGHSTELAPSGTDFSAFQISGSAHIRPGTASPRCAQGSVGGSASSNRPNGAISASRRTLVGHSAAISAASRRTHRTAGEVGAIQSRLRQQIAHREQPVEMRIERRMTAVAAREARQRRHDHRAALRQFVEERHPARQPAETGEKSQFRAAALAPDAGGKAVDIDGQRLGFAHVMLHCWAALTGG